MDCKGLQVKELSLKSGISENTLKSYLKESSAEPSLSKLILLSQALNVSLDKLCLNQNQLNPRNNIQLEQIVEKLQKFSENELSLVLLFTHILESK